MTTCETWDIILVPFQFTHLRAEKKRPALVVSPAGYNTDRDVVILFITSNLSSFGKTGDYTLSKWRESGLPKPSMVRMKFATIERSMIIKKLGSLGETDIKAIKQGFVSFFDLKNLS